jgi:hypothetical protein
MLTAHGAKRDTASQFKLDRRLDILDDGKLIGQLACDMGATQAALTIDDRSYTMAATAAEQREPLGELLHKAVDTRAKRPDKAFALKDADGDTRALAQRVKSTFMVAHEGTVFVLRKASFFSPPYNLYRTSSDQLLGSVGQKALFNRTLHMDLPAGFDAAFQVFLLVLSLHLAAQRAASASSDTYSG